MVSSPLLLFANQKSAKLNAMNSPVDTLAVADSFQSIDYAHVVILVIDVSYAPHLNLTELQIAKRTLEQGRPLIVVANKCDVVPEKLAFVREEVQKQVDAGLHQSLSIPVVPISALTGKGVNNLMPAVLRSYDRWNFRVNTSKINRWLNIITNVNPFKTVGGRQMKCKFMSQVSIRPPGFAIWVTDPDKWPVANTRFLSNHMQREFDFYGVPVRFFVRGNKENKFAGKKREMKGKDKRLLQRVRRTDSRDKMQQIQAEKERGARNRF
jgi:GTP-binding protein